MGLSSRAVASSVLSRLERAAASPTISASGMGRGTEVAVKIDGTTEFRRNIDLLYDLLEDFDYILDIIEANYYIRIKDIFEKEGAVEGSSKWRKLSPMYKSAKDVLFPGAKILTRTGALYDSFYNKGSKFHMYIRTPNSLAIGSKLKTEDGKYPLAQLHQRGYVRPKIVASPGKVLRWYGFGGNPVFATSAKSVQIPARPIVTVSPKMRDMWSKQFHEGFINKWKGMAGN